jgi:hypothetical protein
MAAQDVAELTPRVRRAIEGPVPPATGSLTTEQLTPVAADAVGDLILVTAGRWPHTLTVTDRDATANFPTAWEVDPALDAAEEGLVAMQAAINYAVTFLKDMKTSERISNEGQDWEWTKSATALRDWLKLIQSQRDEALTALQERYPVMARVASFLATRDAVTAQLIEPYQVGGLLGGGIEQDPSSWRPIP